MSDTYDQTMARETFTAEHGAPFDFVPAYRALGYSGIAWYADEYETVPDEDTEWTGYKVPTGMIVAHMIGDDETFTFDPDDLEPIGDLDYCAQCGQIGCTHDGRDRDDDEA